ncbi:MAG: phosphatidylserine decarboxylase [Caldilineaceae bacterium]|nr:phosphatidylserine decarboxylase [Caldilineaceae bacterium]
MIMVQGAQIAWREVRAIVVGLMGLTLLGLGARRRWLAALAGVTLLWVFSFFRDPMRTPDARGDNLLLAPADGRIRKIEVVHEPHFLHTQAQRVTIFLSIFDVHVQRSPCAGDVAFLHYQPGSFAPAFLHSADDNEANLLGLHTAHGPIAVTQMTGILARRIVCWKQVGDALTQGERFGLIKFGSRVDLYLPLDAKILVQPGQQVYGGQTVIGVWSENR